MTIQIKSSKTGSLPFYETEVSSGSLTIISDHDGGTDSDLSGESVEITGRPAVTQDGRLVSPPSDDDQIRAHLGVIQDGSLTRYEFVDVKE